MTRLPERWTAGSLILVNAEHPCRGTLPPECLAPVGGGMDGVLLERHAAALLNRLMADIRGWDEIAAVSGWRSEAEQHKIWEDSCAANGAQFTEQFVARPGCSEHHTGLAVDLGLRQEKIDFIRPDFPDAGVCHIFRERAARYGFIRRYPPGKEHITAIAHEPWHFRYVGIPHAEIISALELTLEEYLELLRDYPAAEKSFLFQTDAYEFRVYRLAAEDRDRFAPEEADGCLVSGDNCGGLIITTWKHRER